MRKLEITVPVGQQDLVYECLTVKCHCTNIEVHRGVENGRDPAGPPENENEAGGSTVQFNLYTSDHHAGVIIGHLETVGCGRFYGLIAMLQVVAIKPLPKLNQGKPVSPKRGVKEELKGMMSEIQESLHTTTRQADALANKEHTHMMKEVGRLAVEEMYYDVMSGCQLSFDYMAFVVIAATIASIGLGTDNPVMVVASMLVSPLMGPILGFTFGSVIGDKEMVSIAIKVEIIGATLTFLCGCLVGLIMMTWGEDLDWPTKEMEGRGEFVSLAIGLGFAIPSGAGVALSITSGGVNSLVGVAIAAALLPPVANSGLNLMYAIFGPYMHSDVDGAKFGRIAGLSFLLFCLNVMVIYLVGIGFFKLKHVTSPKFKSAMWRELPNLVVRKHDSASHSEAPKQEDLATKPATKHWSKLAHLGLGKTRAERSLMRQHLALKEIGLHGDVQDIDANHEAHPGSAGLGLMWKKQDTSEDSRLLQESDSPSQDIQLDRASSEM